MAVPKFTNLYVVCGLATIGGLLQGFGVSSLSAMLATWQYKDYFNHPESVTQGGIMASLAGGCLLGALFSSWVGDRLGRRDSMAVACCIFIVGSTLMCAVQKQAMLIIARMVNGFAVGLMTSQGYGPFLCLLIKPLTNNLLTDSPIYIAEMSPPHRRGRLISLQQWMITWGVCLPLPLHLNRI